MAGRKEERERWERETLAPVLARQGERLESFETPSGIPVDRLYTEDDLDPTLAERMGFPGEYPFLRGVYPTMYRGRLWTMRQYAGFGTARETNRRYRYLLEHGQSGLSVAFDLPTQMGYDSDHPMARGEVGRVGVAIDSLEDMRVLFEGIPLDQVSVSMTINATAPILLAMYVALADEQGVPRDRLAGTVQNDILKEYIARGTYIYPVEPSLRLVTDVFAFCAEEVPRWNTISISGYHMREAGCTAVQEVAFTLANAIAYVEAAVAAGLEVDQFAPRLSFFFNADSEFFEEVAKFRAARRLWARIMRDRFGAQDPRSLMLRFHTQTSGASLTAQQPLNNVVRVTLQALAAVLGGTQSLHTNAYDEALALPTEASAGLALRTQQIIAHEAGVTDTVDPLGGSHYVEALTAEIERRAQAYLDRIDEMGGAVAAIDRGFIQREIQDSAYVFQQQVEKGERLIVGVNAFTTEAEAMPEILKVDPRFEQEQAERVRRVRAQRDAGAVASALERLEQAARGRDNVLPYILDAVRVYATLGEICNVLRGVFGEYRPHDEL